MLFDLTSVYWLLVIYKQQTSSRLLIFLTKHKRYKKHGVQIQLFDEQLFQLQRSLAPSPGTPSVAGSEQFAVGAQLQSDANEEGCAVRGAEIPEVSVSARPVPSLTRPRRNLLHFLLPPRNPQRTVTLTLPTLPPCVRDGNRHYGSCSAAVMFSKMEEVRLRLHHFLSITSCC